MLYVALLLGCLRRTLRPRSALLRENFAGASATLPDHGPLTRTQPLSILGPVS
jgi:hypothetical protein